MIRSAVSTALTFVALGLSELAVWLVNLSTRLERVPIRRGPGRVNADVVQACNRAGQAQQLLDPKGKQRTGVRA